MPFRVPTPVAVAILRALRGEAAGKPADEGWPAPD
jgi:hypothetical protein